MVAARKVGHSEKVSGPRGCLGCLAFGAWRSGHHGGAGVSAGFWTKNPGILASKSMKHMRNHGDFDAKLDHAKHGMKP